MVVVWKLENKRNSIHCHFQSNSSYTQNPLHELQMFFYVDWTTYRRAILPQTKRAIRYPFLIYTTDLEWFMLSHFFSRKIRHNFLSEFKLLPLKPLLVSSEMNVTWITVTLQPRLRVLSALQNFHKKHTKCFWVD